MDPRDALAQLGGVAQSADLLRLTSRKRLRTALERGDVERLARGRYRLPDADRALARAARAGGVVSHLSAAVVHGWEVAHPPPLPWVTVPRKAKVTDRRAVNLVYGDLTEERVVTGCTRTVVDCARRLPFPEALAVADSALRRGDVDGVRLVRAADEVRGKGAASARRVARYADARAANPFESVLRALALEAGLDVEPQGAVTAGGRTLHPDVLDRDHRLALEADSWAWHGARDAFARDCWRYTVLTLAGWRVLRFTHHQVMRQPDWVVACLRTAAAGVPVIGSLDGEEKMSA
ncbi:MAG: DUF559 domain-containing protein [Nocardioides sp.]|nr:DUF559 domain-containing protein [Nocardioides sp.]